MQSSSKYNSKRSIELYTTENTKLNALARSGHIIDDSRYYMLEVKRIFIYSNIKSNEKLQVKAFPFLF